MPVLEPIIIAVSFGMASCLLWLGAAVAHLATTRPIPVSMALTLVAALLATCGLWWPGHALTADTTLGSSDLLNMLPALLLVLCAGATGALAREGKKVWVLFGLLAVLLAAYFHAMLAAPGWFRLARTAGGVGAGAAFITLCASLVGAQLRYGTSRGGPVLRVAAALLAAATVCAGAVISVSPGTSATLVWTELLMLVGLIGVAAVLCVVLGQGSAAATRSTGPLREVPYRSCAPTSAAHKVMNAAPAPTPPAVRAKRNQPGAASIAWK